MAQKICLSFLIFFGSLQSQDLFNENSSVSRWDQSTPNLSYELNGFIRGAFFGGKMVDKHEAEVKSAYGELGLRMRVRKGKWGDGYTEVRFRRGSEFNESISEVHLKEAYVNMYIGNLDLRVGNQIVVWGRADGFNPTNNITPQNMLVRSSDEDDRRESNFLMRFFYHLTPLRLELIWVPHYSPSVLPTQLFPFPDYVKLGEAVNPNNNLKNSSIALKLDLVSSKLDGSVSYFRGYMPMGGIDLSNLDFTNPMEPIATVVTKPYKMNVLGGDFSTTLGSFGLRGELAYRDPINENPFDFHVPNPDLQVILGLDKTMGDLSLILQYIGRTVIDYEEFQTTDSPLDELELKNRMIASQSDKMSHALFIRPSLALIYETMHIEILGFYNITTEETLLRPVFSYDLTDALTLKIGGEWYTGPGNTLFGVIEEGLSSCFFELKVSF